MIFFIFLFTGLLSQKDFSTSSSCTKSESPPDDLFLFLLTFSITISFAASQISVVSSSETTTVLISSVSDVKCQPSSLSPISILRLYDRRSHPDAYPIFVDDPHMEKCPHSFGGAFGVFSIKPSCPVTSRPSPCGPHLLLSKNRLSMWR